jgi:hypothetical protein
LSEAQFFSERTIFLTQRLARRIFPFSL